MYTKEEVELFLLAREDFEQELDAWMRWFRSGRISQALGWLTPDERRLALGCAA